MGANLCSANIAQGAFASCAVCNTVDAADWIFCLDTRQAPIKKKRRAKDKYAKEAEEIDVERLEELTLELFKAHDLNDDGLLQESELITLNVRIAMLHHDKAAVELQDVRDTYQRLFRTKLDHLGRAVPFDTFRRYARGVLEELDHDPEAQEMILEQFVAEAKAGREFLDGAEDTEIRFPVAGQDSAYWLAVDGFGNIFYTDAEAGSISMIAAEDVSKGLAKGRTLLSSETLSQVASPAGLAADATALYWANLKGDQSTGTLLRSNVSPLSLANKTSKNASAAMTLAGRQMAGRHYVFQAAVKDICLAGTNVFFTGDGKSLFAVKADGSSDPTEVASLKQPKGCTYDQETTLFVADQSLNGIYSLPANMQKLRQAKHVRKVVSLKGPQQIAIFYGPSSNKFLQLSN